MYRLASLSLNEVLEANHLGARSPNLSHVYLKVKVCIVTERFHLAGKLKNIRERGYLKKKWSKKTSSSSAVSNRPGHCAAHATVVLSTCQVSPFQQQFAHLSHLHALPTAGSALGEGQILHSRMLLHPTTAIVGVTELLHLRRCLQIFSVCIGSCQVFYGMAG